MKILVTAGGTGGHIYPAYALIQWIKEHHAEDQIFYIGSRGRLEEKVIPDLSVHFVGLPMRGMPRKLSPALFLFILLTALSFFMALFHIIKLRPGAIIGFGGYVTFPVLLAGKLLGKKIILHEQNSVPGLANRFFGPLADHIAINLPLVKPLPGHKTVQTGTPLRKEFLQCSREEGYKRLGIDPSLNVLLVMGGSQGALFINQLIVKLLPVIESSFPQWQVIHLTGPKQYPIVTAVTEKMNLNHYHSYPYKDDMASVLAVSDLALCRAGATSLSELSGKGVPALLIPYPAASENHQFFNGDYFQKNEAARLFEEQNFDEAVFKQSLFRLMADPEALQKMKLASHNLFMQDASEKLYRLLKK